jgi:carboxylesterase type B
MAFQPCVLENGPLFKDLLFHSVPPLVNIARGIADDVSILVGVNNSEYTLFMLDGHWRKVLHQKANSSRSKFKTLLCSLLVNFTHKDTRYRELPDLHERAQKVVDFYLPVLNGPEKDSIDDEEAYFAFERIHSVWIFDLAADHLLTMKQHDGGQHTQTLSYRVFSHSPIGDLKACHALELPLVFGTFKTPLGKMLCGDDADAQETSWDMMDHWVNFARGHQFSTKERAFGGGKAPLPGSIFVSLAEKQVWEGFMEKVELDYTMVRKRNAKL